MLSQEWWIEHFVEVISLIVSIAGFIVAGTYLVKINYNSQKIKLVNSPHSPIVQVNGDNNQIGNLRDQLNKGVVVTQPTEINDETNNKKELIKKLENFLDEGKPVSTLAHISLRLANELKMSDDAEWLSNEVNGFKDIRVSPKGGLNFQKAKESDKHRSLIAELNIEFKNGKMESLSIPMFISQSLYDIENWISQLSTASNQTLFVLRAPPPQLMVDQLEVSADERIPYIISKDSLTKITNGVKLKIIEFLGRAKKKV